MDELTAFERDLTAGLEAYVGPRRPVIAAAIARKAASDAARFRVTIPRLPWRLIGAIALLLLPLAGAAIFLGGQPHRVALGEPSARNGLIAYASGGDIYVGDPATGATTAIVTGPELDSRPIFSPDGALVAFLRGDGSTAAASILVVRSDGSDERVVVPSGFSGRGLGPFAWTPGATSLVVAHDSPRYVTPYWDGELSVFDASGVAGPRLLTPPLPIIPGAPYFRSGAEIAPMFEPSNRGRILSIPANATGGPLENSDFFVMWDADLRRAESRVLAGVIGSIWSPEWSPDGSRITFVAGDAYWVMDADGASARRLEDFHAGLMFSPNGTAIAYERCGTDPLHPGGVIVVREIDSGREHVLAATAVGTKWPDGSVPSPDFLAPVYCSWQLGGQVFEYATWSWSPDGRGILFLERFGELAKVVDIESGRVTELGWAFESAPSWQRLAVP